jgi:putative ABC transport system permease protein
MIKSSNLEVGLSSLGSNPLRSSLTIIGIVVGIAAVVTVLSIGKGHEAKIEAEIQRMGASLFWVERTSRSFVSSYPRKHLLSHWLTLADAEAIGKTCTAVMWSVPVSTFFTSGRLNGKSVQLNVCATLSQYFKMKSLELLSGRYLCDEDAMQLSNVCVTEETAGSAVRINQEQYAEIEGRRFRVVGILRHASGSAMTGIVATIHIPITVAQKKLTGDQSIQTILCTAKEGSLQRAMRQVETVLKRRAGGRLDLQLRSSRDIFQRAETLTNTATMVTAGIGMLSLFVGGIGIMNILLASILERTREIGIRLAVGARRKDILIQFLFESICLSILGGILGVVLSIFTSALLSSMVDVPRVLSFEAILVGVAFATGVGVVFGAYPAWRAARLSPVDALRYE